MADSKFDIELGPEVRRFTVAGISAIVLMLAIGLAVLLATR
jgi:hypothetical protein